MSYDLCMCHSVSLLKVSLGKSPRNKIKLLGQSVDVCICNFARYCQIPLLRDLYPFIFPAAMNERNCFPISNGILSKF